MCSVENVSLMNVDGCDCDSNVESMRKWIYIEEMDCLNCDDINGDNIIPLYGGEVIR